MTHFDIIVLGGGPGGYPAAIRAAQLGKKVALVEADTLGGTCLNRGCIPSKTLIAGAALYTSLKESAPFGLSFASSSLDYSQLAAHKNGVVEKMRHGITSLLQANGVTVIKGFGTFHSPHEIAVGEEVFSAEIIILATGTEPRTLPQLPVDGVHIHDSTTLLNLTTPPRSLLIIGGGIIGVEFASLFHQVGTQVTVLEKLPRMIATEAQELSDALTASFRKRGIAVYTSATLTSLEPGQEAILDNGTAVPAESCLVAIGRRPNTHNIALEKAGLSPLENGLLAVNSQMQTSVPHIYAVGDIASTYWLAHVATHQGLIAAENACGNEAHMDYDAIPSAIFTTPEIASVGLSPLRAKEKGLSVTVTPFPFRAVGKAQAILHTEGFAQLVAEEKTGRLLGAQVMGKEASTLIAEITLAIAHKLTLENLSHTLHTHPTLSEVWGEAAMMAEGFPLHLFKKRAS